MDLGTPHDIQLRTSAALGIVLLMSLGACGSVRGDTLQPLAVFATSSATPWLETAYECAPAGTGIVLSSRDKADLILQLTEPRPLTLAAFQIGQDDLLVVTHPQVGVGPLLSSQVEAIFAGQISNWSEVGGADQEVQVWVYPPDTDVQQFFDHSILHERPPSSLARLAVSEQHMSDSVGSSPGSVGILTRRWLTGNTPEILSVATVPVLALMHGTPEGALASLVTCLQSHK